MDVAQDVTVTVTAAPDGALKAAAPPPEAAAPPEVAATVDPTPAAAAPAEPTAPSPAAPTPEPVAEPPVEAPAPQPPVTAPVPVAPAAPVEKSVTEIRSKNGQLAVTLTRGYDGCKFNGATEGEPMWPVWDSESHPKDDEGRFMHDYSDYFQERVLILEGAATLSPEDGTPAFTVGAGDFVVFHQGFVCQWQITAPMRKRWSYFNAEGEPVAPGPGGIVCDQCGEDCFEECYSVKPKRKSEEEEPEMEDLCVECFVAHRKDYEAIGEHLKNGEVVGGLPNGDGGPHKRRRS